MATAKIATLAVRTLAKPIATQLKNQAAQHETFRKICISLAQRMHRTEMALRANLLPNGATQKVRPLNDAKAIANGANAISEGFLFFVAVTLILGETYRGSRKKAEQRDRTEEELGRLKEQMARFADRLGVDLQEIKQELEEEEQRKQASGSNASEDDVEQGHGGSDGPNTPVSLPRQGQLADERRTKQLQTAVEVLLRLAIKNGWIAGDEALQLDGIMRGDESAASSAAHGSPALTSAGNTSPGSPSSSSTDSAETLASPSVIQQVALERARALAREVRGDREDASRAEGRSTEGLEDSLLLGASSGTIHAPSGGDASLSDLYDLLARINQEVPRDSQQ